MCYVSKMVGFCISNVMCVYVKFSTGGFGSVTACYKKRWLLPSPRVMYRGGTWRYGLACVVVKSVFGIKGKR